MSAAPRESYGQGMRQSTEYHFIREGRHWGPVTLDELREMVAARDLPATTPVRCAGTDQWTPFESLLESIPMAVRNETFAPGQPLGYFTSRADDVVHAGFWERALAMIIDLAIVLVPVMIVVLLLEPLIARHPHARQYEALARLIVSGVLWLYFAGQESSAAQATIGKRALGLSVTDLEGRPISFARATGRFFGKYISWMLLSIGFIMAGFTQRRQGLHDLLSGCLVVRRRGRT